jgi:hypothetical protein
LKNLNLELQIIRGDEELYGAAEGGIDTGNKSSRNVRAPATLTADAQGKDARDNSSEGRGAARKKRGMHH